MVIAAASALVIILATFFVVPSLQTDNPNVLSETDQVATDEAEVGDEDEVADDLRDRIESQSQDRKTRVRAIKEENREERQERKDEFRERLTRVRSEKRQEILTRLVDKFNSVNDKWVDVWAAHLDRLSKLLDKMDAKASDLAGAGSDTSAYEAASAIAKNKIDEASLALEAQAENSYVFDITTESSLGTEVKAVTAQHREDIQTTHELVKAAKTAVQRAFSALKNVGRGGSTPLPTITPPSETIE